MHSILNVLPVLLEPDEFLLREIRQAQVEKVKH